MEQYTLFSESDFGYAPKQSQQVVNEKVAQSFSITANVMQALVDGGVLDMEYLDTEDVENIVSDYAAVNGIRLNWNATRKEEREYDSQMEELTAYIEKAAERLNEAVNNALEAEPRGYFSRADFVEQVWHYLGINATIRQEEHFPYRDFMNICKNYINEPENFF